MDMHVEQHSSFVKAGLLVAVSLALGLLFDYFFYEKVPGISFPLYVLGVMAGLCGVARFYKKRISKEVAWLFVPLAFFSLMVAVRSSTLLTFLNITASLLLLLAIARVSFGGGMKHFLLTDYIKVIFLPFQFIQPLFQTLSDVFLLRGAHNEKKIAAQVVKGVAMALPVVVVFALLFSSADLVFKKYVSDVFSLDLESETIFRCVLVLIVTLVYTGAYAYSLREKKSAAAASGTARYTLGKIEGAIVHGCVNALFLLFILVQLAYLFGGESAVLAQGFTYAEYARRGFFELIAVAVIAFLLVLVTEKYAVKKDSGHGAWFKVLSTALVVQVMVIMASAFIRLMLYEDAYGFTTLRLYSHAFIIFLAAVFCLLLYKIYANTHERRLAFQMFISIVLFLAVMNALNPDAFIARRNVEQFASTGKIDVVYLNRMLSSDALPLTITLLDAHNEAVRKEFASELYRRTQSNDAQYFSTWQSFNLSRMKADAILAAHMHRLEQYPN